jgi:hypothetical protein
VEYVTGRELRAGPSRAESPGFDRAFALAALSFDTIRNLMRAANLLKESGFHVEVAPRRTAGCGVVLLLAPDETAAGQELLRNHGLVPHDVTEYLMSDRRNDADLR